MIEVKNPHSILWALKKRPKAVKEIWISEASLAPAWKEVVALAEKNRIQIKKENPQKRSDQKPQKHHKSDRKQGGRMHSNLGALLEPKSPVSLPDLFQKKQDGYGVWIALDQLQDTQNVGSIFRTAAFLGVKGVILTEERSAGLTSVVYDISSGGVELLPFSSEVNLRQVLDQAKEAGLWVLSTSEHESKELSSLKLDRDWLIVFGNEEKGVRKLILEHSDEKVSISKRAELDSLNVASAASIVIHHFCSPHP